MNIEGGILFLQGSPGEIGEQGRPGIRVSQNNNLTVLLISRRIARLKTSSVLLRTSVRFGNEQILFHQKEVYIL